MDLRKGTRVEVCSSEDGYGGAWFEELSSLLLQMAGVARYDMISL
jgi:hypothetical protein